MKRILLVAPVPLRFELTQDDSLIKLPFAQAKAFMMPMHIATIAGLTPDEYEVDLWDEATTGPSTNADASRYDLVAMTGFTAHLPRAKVVAQHFREQGRTVAIGGPGISTMPQRHYDDFDHLFIGEAELTWPQFLKDWKAGSPRKVYRQVAPVDLALSPAPRWDSIKDHLSSYHLGGVQTSRGCPFDCEFCDVSYLFGRKYRYKPIDQVLNELAALERLGVWKIIFCDDNFIGNRKYAKDLLREIVAFNRSLPRPLGFATELTIDVAKDDELLALLADANVVEIFIGIESPNKESLKEANKPQNVSSDLIQDIKKVQSYGMALRGSLIVGFDHDGTDIFDHHIRFVQEANVVVPSVRVLMAPPGTALWNRVRREGRLLKTEAQGRYFGNPGTTNIVPKHMTRTELHSGYLKLIQEMYDWDNFTARMKGFIAGITRRPNVRMTSREWKRLVPFVYFMFTYLDRRTFLRIANILLYTAWHAPFMLPRLVGLISRQYGYANRPKLSAAIQQLIDEEEREGVPLEVDREEPLISDAFKVECEKILAEITEDVYQRLADKSSVEEALIEVFVEFHSRYGREFQSFAGDAREALRAVTEDRVTRRNRTANGAPRPQPTREEVVHDVPRMSDRIINAVEQELLIAQARSGNPGGNGTSGSEPSEDGETVRGLPMSTPVWD